MKLKVGDLTQHKHFKGPELLVVKIEKKLQGQGEGKIICRYLNGGTFYEHGFFPVELLNPEDAKKKPIKVSTSY